MTNTAQALNQFWNGFGIPAYTSDTVPDEQELPYIVYNLTETDPLESKSHYAQVFYRSTSNTALLAKVDEILAAFHNSGNSIRLECSGGYVVLRNPTVQMLTDQVPEIRYAYIDMQLNCYHL